MINIFNTFGDNTVGNNKKIFDYLANATLEKCLLFMHDAINHFDDMLYTNDASLFIERARMCFNGLALQTSGYRKLDSYNTDLNSLMLHMFKVVDSKHIPELLWIIEFNITEIVSDLKDNTKISCLFDEYCRRHSTIGHSIFCDILKKRNIEHPQQVFLANLCFDYAKSEHCMALNFYLDIHKRCAQYIYTHNDDLSYKLLVVFHSKELLLAGHNASSLEKITKKIIEIQEVKYPGTYNKHLDTAKLLDMTESVDFWKNSYLSSKNTYSEVDISELELF